MAAAGFRSALKFLGGGGPLVLAYHTVGPLHPFETLCNRELDAGAFERQIRTVADCLEVVPLADLLASFRDGRRTDRLAAITFDDGWRSALEIAVPILARLGLPATIFVNPAFVGNRAWPAYLAAAWLVAQGHGEPLRLGLRDRLPEMGHEIAALSGPALVEWTAKRPSGDPVLAGSLDCTFRTLGIEPARLPRRYALFADLEQIESLDPKLFSLGSHGFEHIHYASNDAVRRREDLERSFRWSAETGVGLLDVFALPYGALCDLGDGTTVLARKAGFSAVLLAEGGGFATPQRTDAALFDRLQPQPEWDEKDMVLACHGVRALGRGRRPPAPRSRASPSLARRLPFFDRYVQK